MDRYTVRGSKAGVNTANTVMWQLKSPSGNRPRLRELGIFVDVAPTTAPNFVLARSTGLGTSSATLTADKEDTAAPAVGVVADSAWSAAPTFTTAGPFLRQATLQITAGSGIVWTFAQEALGGLLMPVSAGLCIANTLASGATTGTFSFYAVWDE